MYTLLCMVGQIFRMWLPLKMTKFLKDHRDDKDLNLCRFGPLEVVAEVFELSRIEKWRKKVGFLQKNRF
jgi:hypothetical protein